MSDWPYESYPPSLWGGGGGSIPATGATAGIPGTFTPPGSTPPATVAALQGGIPNAVVASPGTAWTVGQYVQTGTAGAPGEATWTGSAWVGGRAPALQDEPPSDDEPPEDDCPPESTVEQASTEQEDTEGT